MSSMTSCTKAGIVRADLLFENFTTEGVSTNGKIWIVVSLALMMFSQNAYFYFSLPFTEIWFCSDLFSLFLLSNISFNVEGIVLKSLRSEKEIALPSVPLVIIFVWLNCLWTTFFLMTFFSTFHACVGDFWRFRGVGESVGFVGWSVVFSKWDVELGSIVETETPKLLA